MDKQQNNINIDIDEDDRKWVIRDYLDSDNEEGFYNFSINLELTHSLDSTNQ